MNNLHDLVNAKQAQPILQLGRVAFIGNYLPRRCGIATFTTDICRAVAAQYPATHCFALAVNDPGHEYDYPDDVRFEIEQEELASYQQAANFLNINDVEMVCLQHEYGIFGGEDGEHILTLLRALRMPVVTTLHTVLREPTPKQRAVLIEVAHLSDRLVVMSEKGQTFLHEIYGISPDKIDFIPHGIPDVPFVDPNFYKDEFDVEGKRVLLTFGLLSENKGIENVIRALPAIRARHPDVVYLLLGATHPNVVAYEGERYRESLVALAEELGVAETVRFHNKFVELDELVKYIGAADIYITPYRNQAQITSGTLAYTVGAGKAVVSTPYWYAEELLGGGDNEERGRLVPFDDPAALAQQVTDLLDHEAVRHAMRKRAYTLGRQMVWSEVAQRYCESFGRARLGNVDALPGLMPVASSQAPLPPARTLTYSSRRLPPLNLNHLHTLTDDTGLIQHAIFTVPNYNEGYTTDDNARALILTTLLEEFGCDATVTQPLSTRYLAFLGHAFNRELGRFRNFMRFDRHWLEEVGSEDSHARALWALGTVLGRSADDGLRGFANEIFARTLHPTVGFTSPRAWAFTLLGIHEYLRTFSGDRLAHSVRAELGERLLTLYQQNRAAEQGENWCWFEDILTYANAQLPHALLLCGQWMERADMTEAGLESLAWLMTEQYTNGHFAPIGCNDFYRRGQQKARFDQQPIEAHSTVSACLQAYHITGDERWRSHAEFAFNWFFGLNDIGLALYDPTTGGCRDGLHPDRVNRNQGAESTLAFLLSRLEIEQSIEQTVRVFPSHVAIPALRNGEDGVGHRGLVQTNGSAHGHRTSWLAG